VKGLNLERKLHHSTERAVGRTIFGKDQLMVHVWPTAEEHQAEIEGNARTFVVDLEPENFRVEVFHEFDVEHRYPEVGQGGSKAFFCHGDSFCVAYFWFSIGLRSTPKASISTSTTSPAFM